MAFYESVAAEDLPVPRAALSEEIWQKVLYHPGEERRLSLLFSCVAPVIALTRAQDGRSFRLKDRYRLEAKTDPSGVARLFDLGASVLSVPRPAVYYNQEFTRDAEILNLRDPTGTSPTVAVGPSSARRQGRAGHRLRRGPDPGAHATRPPGAVAQRRPVDRRAGGHRPRGLQALRAERAGAQPRDLPAVPHLFERMLPPQALEPLSSLAPWLTTTGARSTWTPGGPPPSTPPTGPGFYSVATWARPCGCCTPPAATLPVRRCWI